MENGTNGAAVHGYGQGWMFNSAGVAQPTRRQFLRNWQGVTANDNLPSIFGVGRTGQTDLFDPRRNIEDECGWPRLDQQINIEAMRQLYDRFSIANRVVQVLSKESWQVQFEVVEDQSKEENTEFEQALDELETVLQGGKTWHEQEGSSTWQEHLLRADILSGIGHFGIILLLVDDGRDLSTALDGVEVVANVGGQTRKKRLNFSGGNAGGPQGPRKHVTINKRVIVNGRMVKRSERTVIEPQVADPRVDGWCRKMDVDAIEATFNEVYPDDYYDAKYRGKPKYAPLNDHERDVLARMRKEGEYIENRHAQVVNAKYRREERDGDEVLVRNADKKVASIAEVYGSDASYDKQYSLGFPFGLQGPADASMSYRPGDTSGVMGRKLAPKGQRAAGAGVASDSREGVAGGEGGLSNYPNKDANPYSGLMTFPGLSPSGTDQQYFGIQFGPSEALSEQPAKVKRKLLGLRVFDESLVQVVRYEWNIKNPRFAMPVMYRVTLNDPRIQHTGVGLPMATVFVHWSRIIHVNDTGDHPNSSEIFSNPRMQGVFDDLLDLRKMYGADGEAVWRNAIQKLLLSTHPSLGGDAEIDPLTMRQNIENFFNSLQPYAAFNGMVPQMVGPEMADITPHVDKRIESICIKIACPVPVFKGYEIGEQASENNEEKWNNVLRGRQKNYLTPRLVVPFIDRLIYIGVLPEPDSYQIVWPELESMNSTNKSANALTRTQAMSAYVSGQVNTVLMSPMDFLTRELGFDDMEAEGILDNLEEHVDEFNEQQDDRQQDLIDKGLAPDPTEPPPGLDGEGGGDDEAEDGGKPAAVSSDVGGEGD